MGVDRWNDPPSRRNCLFVEGICRVRVKVRRLCRRIALQHVPSSFPLPSFLFSTNIAPSSFFGFFLMSSSRISPSECVTAVLCLFSFSSAHSQGCEIYAEPEPWRVHPASSSLSYMFYFFFFPHMGCCLEILNEENEGGDEEVSVV